MPSDFRHPMDLDPASIRRSLELFQGVPRPAAPSPALLRLLEADRPWQLPWEGEVPWAGPRDPVTGGRQLVHDGFGTFRPAGYGEAPAAPRQPAGPQEMMLAPFGGQMPTPEAFTRAFGIPSMGLGLPAVNDPNFARAAQQRAQTMAPVLQAYGQLQGQLGQNYNAETNRGRLGLEAAVQFGVPGTPGQLATAAQQTQNQQRAAEMQYGAGARVAEASRSMITALMGQGYTAEEALQEAGRLAPELQRQFGERPAAPSVTGGFAPTVPGAPSVVPGEQPVQNPPTGNANQNQQPAGGGNTQPTPEGLRQLLHNAYRTRAQRAAPGQQPRVPPEQVQQVIEDFVGAAMSSGHSAASIFQLLSNNNLVPRHEAQAWFERRRSPGWLFGIGATPESSRRLFEQFTGALERERPDVRIGRQGPVRWNF